MADSPPEQPQAVANFGGLSARERLQSQSQELGLLGKLFGSRENAPTNISGFAVLLFSLMWFLTAVIPLPAGTDRPDLLKSILALILAALGYLFGASSARR